MKWYDKVLDTLTDLALMVILSPYILAIMIA